MAYAGWRYRTCFPASACSNAGAYKNLSRCVRQKLKWSRLGEFMPQTSLYWWWRFGGVVIFRVSSFRAAVFEKQSREMKLICYINFTRLTAIRPQWNFTVCYLMETTDGYRWSRGIRVNIDPDIARLIILWYMLDHHVRPHPIMTSLWKSNEDLRDKISNRGVITCSYRFIFRTNIRISKLRN